MSTPTPTDPREEKKPKVFLVTMRARKNDGATETVSFRSGIFACESEAHAKVAMLEGREPEFSIDELDAKPFDTTFLTAQLESTNSKLAAEIAELKATVERCGEAINHHIEIEATLRAELEAARKERDEAQADVRELRHQRDESDARRLVLRQDRDTALAAKDAAEKRVVELEADAEHFHEVRDEFRDKLEMLRDELRVTRKSRDEAIASMEKACLEASETIAILESRIKELETLIKEGKRTKDRVVELEASLDELSSVVGLTAFKHEGQRAVLQEAFDNARALLANRPSSP